MVPSQAAFGSEALVIYHIPIHSSPTKAIGEPAEWDSGPANCQNNITYKPRRASPLANTVPLELSEEMGFRRRPCGGTVSNVRKI